MEFSRNGLTAVLLRKLRDANTSDNCNPSRRLSAAVVVKWSSLSEPLKVGLQRSLIGQLRPRSSHPDDTSTARWEAPWLMWSMGGFLPSSTPPSTGDMTRVGRDSKPALAVVSATRPSVPYRSPRLPSTKSARSNRRPRLSVKTTERKLSGPDRGSSLRKTRLAYLPSSTVPS